MNAQRPTFTIHGIWCNDDTADCCVTCDGCGSMVADSGLLDWDYTERRVNAHRCGVR